MIKIFGDSISGNCLKVKWTADHLRIPYTWIETDIMNGESRTPSFLSMNAAGQVPVILPDDGRPIAQSNAIIIYLAEGSALIPTDAYDRAKMMEWLFWEQYSHEPYIAVARFQVVYQRKSISSLDSRIIDRGNAALTQLEAATRDGQFLVGGTMTVADISLVAYTRMANQGGFDLDRYPNVQTWVRQIEGALNIGSVVP